VEVEGEARDGVAAGAVLGVTKAGVVAVERDEVGDAPGEGMGPRRREREHAP
jgi:hypothetical protein